MPPPPKTSPLSMGNHLSPDEVAQLRVGLREYVDVRIKAIEQQLVTAQVVLDTRLSSMNEFRAALTDQSANFFTRPEHLAWREKVEGEQKVVNGRLSKGEERLQTIEQITGLVKWIGGAVVLLFIGLIWAILTHTIELVPK